MDRSSGDAFEKAVLASGAAQHRRVKVDISVRVDRGVVDVCNRGRPNVQRSRELAGRHEWDKAATRHAYEVDVVGGNDLTGAHGELPDPKGGVGDG